MAELLDLDAEVLHCHLSDVTEWLQGRAGPRRAHRMAGQAALTGTQRTDVQAERLPGRARHPPDLPQPNLSLARPGNTACWLSLAETGRRVYYQRLSAAGVAALRRGTQ